MPRKVSPRRKVRKTSPKRVKRKVSPRRKVRKTSPKRKERARRKSRKRLNPPSEETVKNASHKMILEENERLPYNFTKKEISYYTIKVTEKALGEERMPNRRDLIDSMTNQ